MPQYRAPYAPEFRQQTVDLVCAGELVRSSAQVRQLSTAGLPTPIVTPPAPPHGTRHILSR